MPRQLGRIDQHGMPIPRHAQRQIGRDTARVERVGDKSATETIFNLQELGEAQQGELGRLTVVVFQQQQREKRPRDEIRSLDVDLPTAPPLVRIALPDRRSLLQIPRVVDQDI
ncbi:hypothetical protein VTN00DRAFT_2931 [Thermoascus crustaceus]|uniref:uncharacterized protein n=1 Tax=Thermoascus crustaceus TaxID=5088 RepID=UPI003742740D